MSKKKLSRKKIAPPSPRQKTVGSAPALTRKKTVVGKGVRRRRKVPLNIKSDDLIPASGGINSIKQMEDELNLTMSLARATLESTADGILVVNSEGKIETFNQVFVRMWRVPEAMLAERDDASTMQTVVDQLCDPRKFVDKVRYLYAHPEEESYDTLTFKDGRVFERYSRPQRIGGLVIGRVWSFRDVTERTQTVAALRASEDKYRLLFREMLNGFALHEIICDAQGNPTDYRFLEVNPAFERLTGLRAQDIVGRTALQVLPGLERHWIETYGKVALTGEPTLFSNYSAALEKHFEVMAYQPAPSQFACIFADITERKQTEAIIGKYETVFHHASWGMALGDHETGTLTHVNLSFARMHGYSVAEMIGMNLSETIAPEARVGFFEHIRALHEKGQHLYETLHLRKDGSCFPCLADVTEIKDPSGRMLFRAGTFEDITYRKRAQDVLAESEKKYRTLFEAIDEGFCIIEVLFDENERAVDYRFLELNPAFEKQTGLSNAWGRRMRELAPKHEEIWFETYGKIAVTGKPARFEQRAEQLHRWYDVYAFRIGLPEERLVAILFNDISERKRVGDELQLRARRELAVARLTQVALNVSLSALLDEATRVLAETLDVELSKILELQPDGKALRLVAGVGWQPGLVGREKVSTDRQSQAGFTLQTNGPVIVEDLRTEGRFTGPALLTRHDVVSGVSVIIKGVNGPWGVLGAHMRVRRAFTKDDVHFFQTIAGVLSGAIQRQAAAMARHESETRFRQLAENISEVFWLYDPDKQQMLYISPAYESVWGRSCQSVYASPRDWVEAIHPEDRAQVLAANANQVNGTYDEEYRIIRSDGSVRWIHDRAFPVREANGQVHRVAGVAEDITERKQAEAQILASRQILRRLATHLQTAREEERTHLARELHDELAQSLTRLKIDLVWLEHRLSLSTGTGGQDSLVSRVKEMKQVADTAIQRVQRIATGLRPAVLDSLGLYAAVEWLARDFQKHSDITCTASVPQAEPPANRDTATATFRILQESLTNVVRHAQATRVEISLGEEAGQLVLRITDNGRGIATESLSNPLSIGLAGMRERAMLLNGKVEIQSTPGAGTVVEMRLPLTMENPDADGQSQP